MQKSVGYFVLCVRNNEYGLEIKLKYFVVIQKFL